MDWEAEGLLEGLEDDDARKARAELLDHLHGEGCSVEDLRDAVEEDRLVLLAGNDDLLLRFLEVGGRGGIFVYTHLVGPRVKELIVRFEQGDHDGARAIEAEIAPLIDALAVTTNPIPLKAALNMLGHEAGGLRLPLVEATDAEKAVVRAALEGAGALASQPA